MKNVIKFANSTNPIESILENGDCFVATKEIFGEKIKIEFPKNLMPVAEKKEFDAVMALPGIDNTYLEFHHVDELENSKKENEETGKQSAKIDGLYAGALEIDVLNSAEEKWAMRTIAEEIYKLIN